MQEYVNAMSVRRKLAALSQVELAERAGISKGLVSFMENGYRPGPAAIDRVASALDCAPGELYEEVRS